LGARVSLLEAAPELGRRGRIRNGRSGFGAAMQEAAPELEELNLLVDAIKQLDELFLMVIVGEFNSGKSSIINALLGNRYGLGFRVW